jgi:hypothetical protein
MIDEKEIRIGNYIKAQTKGGEWYECELTRELFLRWLHFGGSDFSEPIPLTEEWLLKFGFENHLQHKGNSNAVYDLPYKTDSSVVMSIDFMPINSSMVILTMNVFKSDISEQFAICINGYIICYCKTVHHFQNLYFALTGEELTIKQPKEQHD